MTFRKYSWRSVALSLAITLAVGGPARAFSCAPHDIVFEYRYAQRSSDDYLIVLGRIELQPDTLAIIQDGGILDISGIEGTEVGPTVTWQGQVVGRALGRRYFATPVEVPITYLFLCHREGCNMPDLSDEKLLFLRQRDGVWGVSNVLCGPNYYEATSRDVRRLLQCHRGENCDVLDW